MPKKKAVSFKVKDGLEDETSRSIIELLNGCKFHTLIKRVTIEKYGRGIHLIIDFIPGKKPIIIASDMIVDNPEKLLADLRLICG